MPNITTNHAITYTNYTSDKQFELICFAFCLITSVITDRIERHEVLLPINHNYNKICDTIGIFKVKQKIPRVFAGREKSHLSARVRWCVLSNHLGMTRTVLLYYTVLLR